MAGKPSLSPSNRCLLTSPPEKPIPHMPGAGRLGISTAFATRPGRQEAAGWRHRPPGQYWQGEEVAGRGHGAEGARGRSDAGKPLARKKHERGWGRPRMRYPAAEKLEIIRLVKQSHLSVRRTLAKLGIPPTTFYHWYDRFAEHGPEGLRGVSVRGAGVNSSPSAV